MLRFKRQLTPFLSVSITAFLIAAPVLSEALWPLTWVALVPLFLTLRNVSPGRAFLLGWWMEALITWLAFYWLVGTMVRFGYIPLPLSLLFFGIIGLGNGIRLGLFAWWVRRTSTLHSAWWYRLFLPACSYVAFDYLFPRVFPWYLGVTQWQALPLVQIADITGVHGITFLLVACSVVIASWFPHATQPAGATRRRMGLCLILLLGLSVTYGFWRIHQVTGAMQQAPALRLALIQPNIGIAEKGQRVRRSEHLREQLELSYDTLPQQPDLIIWPETMYPYAVPTQAEQLNLPSLPNGSSPYWLLGILTYGSLSSPPQIFNSALLVGPDRQVLGRYDKQQLLAFGEYIPFQRYLPFLRHISPTIGNLTAGSGGVVTLPNGTRIGPLICYEDILPTLGRQAVQQGASFLVNLTNNAWFGHTRAPYLHRLLAAFRAIENRVYLVRATNTGLTSIIDPLGREQASLPIYERKTLVHTIQPLRLSTLYTRFGDGFAWGCSAVALLLPLWGWRANRARLTRTQGRKTEK